MNCARPRASCSSSRSDIRCCSRMSCRSLMMTWRRCGNWLTRNGNPTMSNEIVPFVDMQRMATSIARSGLFGVRTPDQALALMLVSQAEGRHPALAARDYDIIQQRPAKKAEAMLRDFLAAGGTVMWHELTDTVAKAKFSHPQ